VRSLNSSRPMTPCSEARRTRRRLRRVQKVASGGRNLPPENAPPARVVAGAPGRSSSARSRRARSTPGPPSRSGRRTRASDCSTEPHDVPRRDAGRIGAPVLRERLPDRRVVQLTTGAGDVTAREAVRRARSDRRGIDNDRAAVGGGVASCAPPPGTPRIEPFGGPLRSVTRPTSCASVMTRPYALRHSSPANRRPATGDTAPRPPRPRR
jgi:hypothetical protein